MIFFLIRNEPIMVKEKVNKNDTECNDLKGKFPIDFKGKYPMTALFLINRKPQVKFKKETKL